MVLPEGQQSWGAPATRAAPRPRHQPLNEQHVRHYPLHLPDLPFGRYEHRRLTARDIMVHRIMDDFMNPRRVSRRTYCQVPHTVLRLGPRWPSDESDQRRICEEHVFDPFLSGDRRLGRDLRTLAKMLQTRTHLMPNTDSERMVSLGGGPGTLYIRAQPYPTQYLRLPHGRMLPSNPAFEPPGSDQPCLSDWVLDLVERHYLECECARLRAWFAHLRPPRLPPQQPHVARESRNRNRGGPGGQTSSQTSGQTSGTSVNPNHDADSDTDTNTSTNAATNQQRKSAWGSRLRATRTRQQEHLRHAGRDAKKLLPNDVLHLRSLQPQVGVQDRLLLYDGGGFLTELRRETAREPVLASAQRQQDLWQADHARMLQNFGVMQPPRVMLFPALSDWTGLQSHMIWACRLGQYGATPIRGRKTDGARTTGIQPNSPHNFVPTWKDGTRSARYVPCRRRSQTGLREGSGHATHFRIGSEPPAGSFSAAKLTITEKVGLGCLDPGAEWYQPNRLILVYPRITLAQLDRRSRRRSLSRTRIEEMFEWDVDMADPPEATSTAESATSINNTSNNNSSSCSSSTVEQRPPTRVPSPRHHHSLLGHPHVRRLEPRCENCFDPAHTTAECKSPCGHCGAPSRPTPGTGWNLEDPDGTHYRDPLVWAAVIPYEQSPVDVNPTGPSEQLRSHFFQHGYGPEADWAASSGGQVPPRNVFYGKSFFVPREHLANPIINNQAGLHQKPHKAPQCPLPGTSRCKCMPFPTFHPATKCPVPCRRDCGGGRGRSDPTGRQKQRPQQERQIASNVLNDSASVFNNHENATTATAETGRATATSVIATSATSNDAADSSVPIPPSSSSSFPGPPHRPGSFQHRNAMTCRARCCMCGLPGHSGRECRLRRCRCGGQHLGQDCTWRPACRAPGCPRFLCGLHCRECGRAARPMVGGRCRACLGSPEEEEAGEETSGKVDELAAPFDVPPDDENATTTATSAAAAAAAAATAFSRKGGDGPAQAKDKGKEAVRGRKRRSNRKRATAQEVSRHHAAAA